MIKYSESEGWRLWTPGAAMFFDNDFGPWFSRYLPISWLTLFNLLVFFNYSPGSDNNRFIEGISRTSHYTATYWAGVAKPSEQHNKNATTSS
jgi:hypothetical protein